MNRFSPPRASSPPLWGLALCAGVSLASAQAPEPELRLKASPALQERITAPERQDLPLFLMGEQIRRDANNTTQIEGDARLRKGDLSLRADSLRYEGDQERLRADGGVTVYRSGNVFSGQSLDLQLDTYEGFFTQPKLQLLRNGMHGQAQEMTFLDSARMVLKKAEITTCKRDGTPDWMPDWLFKADRVTLDTDRNIGRAEGGRLVFKGKPLVPLPPIDFPLDEGRKTGFLPPNIGIDNIGGLEVTQPFYWNLAPNRDLTFWPTYWSRRGLREAGEFRYLERAAPDLPFGGSLRADWMDKDQLRQRERWGVQFRHQGVLNPQVAGGTLGLSMNLNRVSDDDYWKDFAVVNSSVNRLLSNDIDLRWSDNQFSTRFLVQRWQTLQDLANPVTNYIAPPFDRVPQVQARWRQGNASGLEFSVEGQLTRFESRRLTSCETDAINCNGSRAVGVLQVSRPFATPYGYLTPKFQTVSRQYQFDGPLAGQGVTQAAMTIPTFSLDTGATLERALQWFDRGWRQTLEPRLFYVQTPYQAQSYLPNYDSGNNAYNFASIFTENTFGGYDRISDTQMVTLGLTTRLIDPASGGEAARLAVAQRLRLRDERVTLLPTDTPAKSGLNDLLVAGGLSLTPQWAVEGAVQYNPSTGAYLRRTMGGRYSPTPYRVISAAMRSQNGESGQLPSRQLDMGWQWPLNDLWGQSDAAKGEGRGLGDGRWYSVGRLNYSGVDRRLVEAVLGFEYDAGCWLGRVVTEQLMVAEGVARKRLLFQLEFVGFSRVGTNALGSIRTHVPRYQPLRGTVVEPSRFGNYDGW